MRNSFLAVAGFLAMAFPGRALPPPEDAVRAVLAAQQRDWNRGDVNAFLDTYEHSGELTFVGGGIRRGFANVQARYRERYPTRDSMGTLQFSDLAVTMLGKGYASVIGRWHLDRKPEGGGATGGYFTLLLRQTSSGWKIFLDHTSLE